MVDFFKSIVEEYIGYSLNGVSDFTICFLGIITILIFIAAIVSLVVEIYLAIKYVKYNRTNNSIGMTGRDIARRILDDNGLQNIKVKCSGSITFGNSYSHFFKKVRLRRRTWKKTSISSLAMASEKSCLAILDKNGDPDMKTRVALTPLTYFGPLFCIPLIILGIIIDLIILRTGGLFATFIVAIALATYIIAFIMSVKILKTEVKAQNIAYEILRNNNMATEQELNMLKELFNLYNIEYINNMVVALLELIYRIVLLLVELKQSNK